MRRRFQALIVLAAGLPLAFFAAIAWFGYRDALADGRSRLERSARVGVEHVRRVIETNEVIARTVGFEARGGPAAVRRRAAEAHQVLRRLAEGLPQIQSIWIWDAGGTPLASSLFATPPATLNVSDREYFQAHLKGAGDWFVSAPLRSRTTGEPFFDVTRRWEHEGRFAGVISVSLRPDYFADFYRRLAETEPGLSLVLARQDGTVLARWPEAGGGEARQTALVRDPNFPLQVSASLERAALLRGWRTDVAVLAAVVFPATAALVWLLLLAMRRAEREAEAYRRLQAESKSRARAEEALRHAQKLEALGLLTGGVAHDFNNLLMVISNNLFLLRRQARDDAERRMLEPIGRAVDAGAKLTRQLLAFARRQPLLPTVLRPADTVPAMRELLQTIVSRTVALEVTADPGAPAVRVDPAELELALINLAVNARDAMPAGGRIAITVSGADGPAFGLPAGPCALIEVSDTGRGIAPEIIGKVFEPFFTTKPVGQGTGLGLSQVYGFCTQAGGAVRVRSEPGRGTTVSMVLPGTTRPAGAADAAQPAPAELGKRVLLVEDNPDIASTTRALLATFGCQVAHAETADDARARLAREAQGFDALVTDIVMPGELNGLQLARYARRRWPRLQVVLMTGYSVELRAAVEEGFQVLPKPVAPETLARALAAPAGGSSAHAGR